MEIGLYTFGDMGADSVAGQRVSSAERLRDLVEETVLADQVGLEAFGLGAHHRPDSPARWGALAAERAAVLRMQR